MLVVLRAKMRCFSMQSWVSWEWFSVWLVGVISTDAGVLRKYLHWILVDGHWPFSVLRAAAVDKTGCAGVGGKTIATHKIKQTWEWRRRSQLGDRMHSDCFRQMCIGQLCMSHKQPANRSDFHSKRLLLRGGVWEAGGLMELGHHWQYFSVLQGGCFHVVLN